MYSRKGIQRFWKKEQGNKQKEESLNSFFALNLKQNEAQSFCAESTNKGVN